MVKFANTHPFKVEITDEPLSKTGKANTKPYVVWIAGGSSSGGSGDSGGASEAFVLSKVNEEADARKKADEELEKKVNDESSKIENLEEEMKKKVDDAPEDGEFYGRQDGLWTVGKVNVEEV